MFNHKAYLFCLKESWKWVITIKLKIVYFYNKPTFSYIDLP